MAIEKEPGQKGVNWSNIAVGELVRHPSSCAREFSCALLNIKAVL